MGCEEIQPRKKDYSGLRARKCKSNQGALLDSQSTEVFFYFASEAHPVLMLRRYIEKELEDFVQLTPGLSNSCKKLYSYLCEFTFLTPVLFLRLWREENVQERAVLYSVIRWIRLEGKEHCENAVSDGEFSLCNHFTQKQIILQHLHSL